MSTSQPASARAPWPADVIHVNEDGWVLINRGSRDGVAVGLRLLVVGTGIRDLHDLFAPDASSETQPPALRIRRTYELLEVVHAEENCAVAIATRTPAARRPTVYRGPEGELLVWAPLPEGYTWPPPKSASDDDAATDDESLDDGEAEEADAPPERAPQDDEPWEEALPLNSVSVGDIVLPALPATTASPSAPHASSVGAIGGTPTQAHDPASPLEMGRTYDWMKKPGE